MASPKPGSELSGYFKTTSGRRWFVLHKDRNILQSYKSEQDVAHSPLETLQLNGAGISFGKGAEYELVITIRGVEHSLTADNHRTMIRWMNILKAQVNVKPALTAQPSLENVLEDETLVLEEKPPPTKPRKRPGFFQRLFGRFRGGGGSSKNRNSTAANQEMESRVVQPAHLRSVVGSMQDITTREATCKKCVLLENRNSYLNEQVPKLNDEIDDLREKVQESEKKCTLMTKDQLLLKREFVEFMLNVLTEDDELYTSVAEISCFKQVSNAFLCNIEDINHGVNFSGNFDERGVKRSLFFELYTRLWNVLISSYTCSVPNISDYMKFDIFYQY